MAFGINRKELQYWKQEVANNKIAFLTHYWQDKRFPGCFTVTKVGCRDIKKLTEWGSQYGLRPEWIDYYQHYPHYDLFGERQKDILQKEGQWEQLEKFNLK